MVKSIKRKAAMLCALCFTFLLAACDSPAPQDIADISDTEKIVISYDYPLALSLKDMYDFADYVVLGTYGEFLDSWNTQRDVDDPEFESETRYSEAHKYEFHIDEVIKGKVPNKKITISIPFYETRTITMSDAIINNEGVIVQQATYTKDYKVDIEAPFYIEPQEGETYILFLARASEFDVYYAAAEPFSIVFNDEGEAQLLSNLISGGAEKKGTITTDQGKTITVETSTGLGKITLTDSISGKTLNQLLDTLGSIDK